MTTLVEATVTQVRCVSALSAKLDETVTAYFEKEEAQAQMFRDMRAAYAQARRRRMRPPARTPEDEPSLYDEGETVATVVMVRRIAAPQSVQPVYRMMKQWEIPDLQIPLWVTEAGAIARNTPSVVKARPMRELLALDHPLVVSQYDAIMRGLETMQVGIREV